MTLDKIVKDLVKTGDPGEYLKQELEQGLEPITLRIERLEKKLDLILAALTKVDAALNKLEPILNFLKKFPILK